MRIFRQYIYFSLLTGITACGQTNTKPSANEQVIQTTLPMDSFLTYLLIPKGQLFFDKPYNDEYISYEDTYLNNVEDIKSDQEKKLIKVREVKCCTMRVYNEKNKIIGRTITCYNKNGDITSYDEYESETRTRITKYKYDDKSNLIESSFSGKVEVCAETVQQENITSYNYDIYGKLIQIKSGDNETIFTYDSLGNKIQEVHKSGNEQWTYKFSYNGEYLVAIEYYQPKDKLPTYNTILEYDTKGRCVKETYYSFGSRSTQREYEYDSLDNIIVAKYLNADLSVSSIDRHYYSLDNNLLKATNENASGEVIPKDTFITNHQLRTVTKITNDKHKIEYQYNNSGQLIKETDFGYDGKYGEQTIYTYKNGLLQSEENYYENKFISKKIYDWELHSP